MQKYLAHFNKSISPETREDNRIRKQKYLALISKLDSAHPNLTKGFFGPESMIWTVFKEPCLLLGSHRALLLQIAHPAIAQGVGQYSEFKNDFVGRAFRTLTSMIHIFFGSTNQAKTSALKLHHIHSMIRGKYLNHEGNQITFCANDPKLLLWVLATIIDTGLVVFETCCRKLSKSEKEQYFEESKKMALLMGISQEEYPENIEAFNDYFNAMLSGDDLFVGEQASEISKALFSAPFTVPIVAQSLAAGFLTPRFIADFELKPSTTLYKILKTAGKVPYLIIPGLLRWSPPYYQALNRISKDKLNQTKFPGHLYDWLAARINSPFLLSIN